ncbi:hypothetical protein SAMN02927924_01363 [Sphingobium faniae]|nr:hypothetical protein SAMN02927924_01363 [Sphingobium faniae]
MLNEWSDRQPDAPASPWARMADGSIIAIVSIGTLIFLLAGLSGLVGLIW